MNISAIGKALDQPLLISKLRNQTPKILCGAAFAYGLCDTIKVPKEERKKRGIKNAVILGAAVGTSLLSAFGLRIGSKQLFCGLVNVRNANEILKWQKSAVDKFLKNNNVPKNTIDVLNKAKTGLLNIKDTALLLDMQDLKGDDSNGKKELLETLFSKKESLSAREIFEETGRLSILGLAPVAAGALGGIAAEKITGENTPESTSKKIKEGAYQFLANIFMCNVGAAGALFGAERLQKSGVIKALTPLQKLAVIMGGIFVTGIMGGSFAANFIGKKILDPIFDKKKNAVSKQKLAWNLYFADNLNAFTPKCKVFEEFVAERRRLAFCNKSSFKQAENYCKDCYSGIYDERKPELLDMALHMDDIATAGVLSGFRWIEPMLPLMYTISGYRAGIGYRNNGE